MSTVAPFSRSEATPQTIQKLLDENAHLIRTIVENMSLKGKAMECIQYQQLLHKNLVYLASLADPNLNIQAILPPPNSSNLIQSQRAISQPQQQSATTTSAPFSSSSSLPPPTSSLQQQQQMQQSQMVMTTEGPTTSNQPWNSSQSMPNSMATMGPASMPPPHPMSQVMPQAQYGMSGGPWSQGGGSYGMQRMPGGAMNQMAIDEQRKLLRLRQQQQQLIQMQQARRLQQQQQQSLAGQAGQGMGMMGGMYSQMGSSHPLPNSGMVPGGMPPSYGQMTTMGGGMPPHSLSPGPPGGPGPMPM